MTTLYYGSIKATKTYLKKVFESPEYDPNYRKMVIHMSPAWRESVMYVFSRSRYMTYLEAMYKAYTLNLLNEIDPESVKAGSSEFVETVQEACFAKYGYYC